MANIPSTSRWGLQASVQGNGGRQTRAEAQTIGINGLVESTGNDLMAANGAIQFSQTPGLRFHRSHTPLVGQEDDQPQPEAPDQEEAAVAPAAAPSAKTVIQKPGVVV